MEKRYLPLLMVLAVMLCGAFVSACDDDDSNKTNWELYADWRNKNTAWLEEQTAAKAPDGSPLYTVYSPRYNHSQFLMRFINDTTLTRNNLRPLYTSTATVNYAVYLYEGTRIDSNANYTSQLSSQGLIDGWSEIITRMHVGDTVEAILPYNLGYGAGGGTGTPPYSALRFNIRLTDVPSHEVRP